MSTLPNFPPGEPLPDTEIVADAREARALELENEKSAGSSTQFTNGSRPHPRLAHSSASDVGSVLARHRSIDDAASLASIDRPPGLEEKLSPSKVYHPFSFPVIALLMPASVFGTLARVGLEALVSYQGNSIFPLAWVQVGGCFIMGMGLGIKDPLGRFYGPLYTAMTTGFCGSFTTFSSWQVAVFQAWVNAGRYHRDWLRDVIDGLTQLVFTLALSLVSVQFGAHLASLIVPLVPALPSPPRRWARYTLSALAVCVYAATFPAYFRMSPAFRHQATAALLFSFPGTLTRYALSIGLNPRLRLFPLGTFAANMFGTALLGAFTVLQSTRGPPGGTACAVLRGLSDGYCGCLTTVSTFATEVAALEDKKSWLYVAISVVTAQLLLLVIMGSSYWAGHVSEQMTCTYKYA
ncbi:hypothetical protein AcW2_006699 [Taiwanofungus camphoratus]|nr:hypothetical protein AcW2_006699 [Antrodia cinnamomea]